MRLGAGGAAELCVAGGVNAMVLGDGVAEVESGTDAMMLAGDCGEI